MQRNLSDITKFIGLLNAFRLIERRILMNGGDRWENDVEHSYHLAMLAWYLVSSQNLSLDCDLAMRYALVHDWVEIYAGDTYIFTKDQSLLESKPQREAEAAKRLKAELSEFPEMSELIERYEKRDDPESRFVYALDKVQPMLQIYADQGRTWKTERVSLAELIENKAAKVAVSPDVDAIFGELCEILKKNEKEFFGDQAAINE